LPLPANSFDVVISNCVLNLVPDKNKAFAEIFRVLKPNGHFCISDVVIKGFLPDDLSKDAEMYSGCVSGALEINKYLEIIKKQRFNNITIHKQKAIVIPHEILKKYLLEDEIARFTTENNGIFSITISGYKI